MLVGVYYFICCLSSAAYAQYSLGIINRQCQLTLNSRPIPNLDHKCSINGDKLDCTATNTPQFYNCEKIDMGSPTVFSFLWNLDGSIPYSTPISSIQTLSASLFDNANPPVPYDSATSTRPLSCIEQDSISNCQQNSCRSCASSPCDVCSYPTCSSATLHQHCVPANNSATGLGVTCTDYRLCDYCNLVPCPGVGCTSNSCENCTCATSTLINSVCGQPSCQICQRAGCFRCNIGRLNCNAQSHETCNNTFVCKDPPAVTRYDVSHNIRISELDDLQELESGVFDPMSTYLETIVIKDTKSVEVINAFKTKKDFPSLHLLSFEVEFQCSLRNLDFLYDLEVSSSYLDIIIICKPVKDIFNFHPLAMKGIRKHESRLRRLWLIGVTDNFILDFCSFPTFWVNSVPEKALRIGDPTLEVNCGCQTAFFRKFGLSIKTAESYGPPRNIIFRGNQPYHVFDCSDGSPLFSHAYSCEGDDYTPLHGIGIDLDLTHKCSSTDKLCPIKCDCEVDYVSCEEGPTVEPHSTHMDIVIQGTDYSHIKRIQADSLLNLTKNPNSADIKIQQLNMLVIALPQLQTIDGKAFNGYADKFFQFHLHNLPLLTDAPLGLLQNAITAVRIDVTFTSLTNLNALQGLKNKLLEELWLNDNKISYIGRDDLAGLPSLIRLRLHNNMLTTIDFCELSAFLWTAIEQPIFMEDVENAQAIGEKYMTLSGNQLECSCAMVYFRRFTSLSNSTSSQQSFRITWEKLNNTFDPVCMLDGDTHYLSEFPYDEQECINPLRLACNCLVPENESPCGCGYCTNNGTCNQKSGACQCLESYIGPSCENERDAFPVCGFNDSLRCYYGGACSYLQCDCVDGWAGAQCDFSSICNPHPCEVWQTCIGVASYVDYTLLNSDLKTLLKPEYHCFDQPILEKQIFGTVKLECDLNAADSCSLVEGSKCLAKDGAYCGCPINSTLSISTYSCARRPVRCLVSSDCLRLGLRYICSYSTELDLEYDVKGIPPKYCVCSNPNLRNSIDGSCISDEVNFGPPATLAPFEWIPLYSYLLIGAASVLLLVFLLCLASCRSNNKQDEHHERVQKLIAANSGVPPEQLKEVLQNRAELEALHGLSRSPQASFTSTIGGASIGGSSVGSRTSRGSRSTTGSVARRKHGEQKKLMDSAIASSMSPFSNTAAADAMYKQKLMTPNGKLYSPLYGGMDPHKRHRKKRKS